MESFWVKSAIGAIKAIAFVYDIITAPIYMVIQKPWKRREESRRVKVSMHNNNKVKKIHLKENRKYLRKFILHFVDELSRFDSIASRCL